MCACSMLLDSDIPKIQRGLYFLREPVIPLNVKEQKSGTAQNDAVVICKRGTKGKMFYRQLMRHFGRSVRKVCVTRGREKR